ncbi:F-box protein At1g47056-like [Miscanthus floridulus]|uniref:F-box protein At1g47056-like n=1 Tax=Miscanthus floridulus TaxID=154761 RepID=UPI003458B552
MQKDDFAPPPLLPRSSALSAPPQVLSSIAEAAGEDHTADLPEELLALVFSLLGSGNRKRCSCVCRHWLAVEAASGLRLALDARAPLLANSALPCLLTLFPAVSKLALKCDRHAESMGDPALAHVADRLGPGLHHLKLRSLRAVTDDGVTTLAVAAANLRKLSVGSCAFRAKGIKDVLRSCLHLEELSVKRLRGLAESEPISISTAGVLLIRAQTRLEKGRRGGRRVVGPTGAKSSFRMTVNGSRMENPTECRIRNES